MGFLERYYRQVESKAIYVHPAFETRAVLQVTWGPTQWMEWRAPHLLGQNPTLNKQPQQMSDRFPMDLSCLVLRDKKFLRIFLVLVM